MSNNMKKIESNINKFALVVDDRDSHLQIVCKAIVNKGYHIETATSYKEAKIRVIEKKPTGGYDLIVSDYDLGSKIWLKYRMFHGFFFLFWCVRQGIKAEMILHSTAFEPNQRFGLFIHGKLLRVIPISEMLVIHVQPKSNLLNN